MKLRKRVENNQITREKLRSRWISESMPMQLLCQHEFLYERPTYVKTISLFRVTKLSEPYQKTVKIPTREIVTIGPEPEMT